jgi:hypothetical protein
MVFAAGAMLLASAGVSAQASKPGLWEISNKVQMGARMEQEMARMQQEMASMPPERRKMMEGMMGKQGMPGGAGGGAATTVRVCMTKEMAERNDFGSAREGCRNSVSPRTGNSMKYSFSCTNPPSSGEGLVTFLSPEEFTSQMTLSTTAQGRTDKVSMEGRGKWLSADCGTVKPASTAK